MRWAWRQVLPRGVDLIAMARSGTRSTKYSTERFQSYPTTARPIVNGDVRKVNRVSQLMAGRSVETSHPIKFENRSENPFGSTATTELLLSPYNLIAFTFKFQNTERQRSSFIMFIDTLESEE